MQFMNAANWVPSENSNYFFDPCDPLADRFFSYRMAKVTSNTLTAG